MNCTGYPAFFDEEYNCKEQYCESCTFDCWKNYEEVDQDA